MSPAWDDHDYALTAQQTTQSVVSTVEVVRLAVQHSGELHRPYLKVVLTEAATDLGTLAQQFGGVQPSSDASDEVRDRTLEQLQQAQDQVDAGPSPGSPRSGSTCPPRGWPRSATSTSPTPGGGSVTNSWGPRGTRPVDPPGGRS
ncbi:hypothetical protein [Nonomuraea sp. NPDC005501]|uniref:hypothetical protein n=1 Tax=Nonomuraea sp. NPDC005501 TaxID=3156884 RepID=UPI0033A743F9